MVIINFKSMELSKDKNTVKIKAGSNDSINIEISILQLAKIFGTDKEVGDECEENGFGSVELEDKCEETKKFVSKFPKIKVWKNIIEFGFVKIMPNSIDKKVIEIYAEDIVGWNNEGIRIKLPIEIYKKHLEGKKFKILINPFYIELTNS